MIIVKFSTMDKLRFWRSVDTLRYKVKVKIVFDVKSCFALMPDLFLQSPRA
jgi:hypothetical protein